MTFRYHPLLYHPTWLHNSDRQTLRGLALTCRCGGAGSATRLKLIWCANAPTNIAIAPCTGAGGSAGSSGSGDGERCAQCRHTWIANNLLHRYSGVDVDSADVSEWCGHRVPPREAPHVCVHACMRVGVHKPKERRMKQSTAQILLAIGGVLILVGLVEHFFLRVTVIPQLAIILGVVAVILLGARLYGMMSKKADA